MLVALVTGIGFGAPAVAQSDTGDPALTVATTASYRVVVDTARVEVAFGYEFENQTAAAAFPGFFESLPVDAVDVVVTDGSGELLAGPTTEEDGFDTWLVGFRRPLEPGETATVTIEWALEHSVSPSGPLVFPGAASFDVYVPGPGESTWAPPEIELPDGFVAVGSPAPPEIAAPYEIVRVSYVDPDAFFSRTVVLPPEITVQDWDSRGAWTIDVVDRAEAVVASLDSWFGPRVDPLELWRAFATSEHPMVGPDQLGLVGDDAESVDHQLAHAWLSDVDVDEPWFIEGLASAFAGNQPDPSGPADVVPVVVNEIGAAGVRSVVDALRDGTITYPGPVAEPQPLPPDWRTLLDHLEGVAGADGVDDLLRATTLLDEAELVLLDQRAIARVDHDALEFRAGGWTLPPYLRHAMAAWEFDDFTAAQAAVSDVIVRRDGLLAWAESLDLPPRDDGKVLFESAETDMAEVNDLLDAQEAALEAFDEAERMVNGDRGLLAGVGLIGQDVEADLESLRVAWIDGDYDRVEHDSHALASRVEGAVGDGTIRLLIPALGLIAVWQLVRMVRRGTAADVTGAADDQSTENTSA